MSKLYFGIVPYGTISDVFITALAGWSDKWLPPCKPDISPIGHLIFNRHEQYVIDLSNGNPMSFREIDYTNKLNQVEQIIEKANGKKVWIGNYSADQALLFKKHFGSDVTTVGISYSLPSRNVVLDTVLGYYVGSKIRDVNEYKVHKYAEYYNHKKQWDKLVPYDFRPDAEWTFDVANFFNHEIFIDKLRQIDGERNRNQLEFYFQWLFRTVDRIEVLNES